MRIVKSKGNPNVSKSSKAIFPESILLYSKYASPFSCKSFALEGSCDKITSPNSLDCLSTKYEFNRSIPLPNVLKNASSSSLITLPTKSCCCINSGKTVSNCFAITGSNWCINGCL